MGSINVEHDGSGNAITLSSDGTSLLLNGTAVGGGGGPTFKTFSTGSIMIGDDATGTINAANYNTGLGVDVFASLTTGDNNTAVGYKALNLNTTSSHQTAVGNTALMNSTGPWNTALGNQAMYDNTTGNANTSVGHGSLANNTTGISNVAVGMQAAGKNTTGSNNVFMGNAAGYKNITGAHNISIGFQSAYGNSAGDHNIVIGDYAMYADNTSSDNIAIGSRTLQDNTTGTINIAIGKEALTDNTTGSDNTAIGYQAGYSNTTGINNTAVGVFAGYSNTTGGYNTFVGKEAGKSNVSGVANAFIGDQAGYYTTSNKNTFIGDDSGWLVTSGANNTILGRFNGNSGGLDIRTSSNNIVLSDGDGNPRVHINSSGSTYTNGTLDLNPTFSTTTSMNDVLRINSSSTGSAGVGHGSAIYFLGQRNDGNTQAMAKIGSVASTNSGTSFASDLVFHAGPSGVPVERVRINSSGDLLVGKVNASTASSNTGVVLNPNGVSSVNSGSDTNMVFARAGTGTMIVFRANNVTTTGTISVSGSTTAYNTSSDYRLKENVDYTWDATTRLKQLKPARFNFIADADTTVDGFLAHEAQAVVPECVTGAKDAVDADGNPEYQGIDQAKLVPLLVKTIQELEARITALEE